jgi:hypothetical protein
MAQSPFALTRTTKLASGPAKTLATTALSVITSPRLNALKGRSTTRWNVIGFPLTLKSFNKRRIGVQAGGPEQHGRRHLC